MPQRLLSGRGYRYVRSSTIMCDVSNASHAPAVVTPICALPKQTVSTTSLTRRYFLAGSMFGAHLLQAPIVIASELQDYISRVFPPPPEAVLFPRKTLNQSFAILLMRSAYETVDDLDFIPMNDFQKDFWKQRASEQEAYNLQYSPLKPRIGDITDPLYFDFISYSQFSTISRDMSQGQQVFKEYCEDCPDLFKVVRRDSDLADNTLLPAAFSSQTGDRIYNGLKDGFRGFQFGAPPPLPPGGTLKEFTTAVQQLLDVMVVNGYALKAEVYDVNTDEQSFKIRVTGPANLWGLASLNYRRALVVNSYDVMAVGAFLRACGRAATCTFVTTASTIEEQWQLIA